MPRYCLFGQTVAIASKMESLSQPQRTNVSADARRHLTNPSAYVFEKNNCRHDLVDDCYFVAAASTFPHPVAMDLNLPVPRGMFRTPNPSPAVSRAPSPVGSAILTPPLDHMSEAVSSFKVGRLKHCQLRCVVC
ncbi:hypothetical protein NP493_671g01029 [Ridgeia piscesae]|uniref:Guanylate cyclase domain-containing protein n=1 Tax=Ridgeia piscesae TaxID=27915 RepID=A0AAD9KRH2_RIDPI|nr:hypothetical protein NP493_671g01029 [Ridgeia piscesae]